MLEDDFLSEEYPQIEVYLQDGLTGPVDNGIPFIAGYSINKKPIKWVILQNEKSSKGVKIVLAAFRDEDEEIRLLNEDEADLILTWNDEIGWVDQYGNITHDVLGIEETLASLFRMTNQEWVIENELNELGDFEGFYVVTKEDGSEPILYEVTIKGEAPEEGSKVGFYTIVYSDASAKIIDWQQDKPHWIERGIGVTSHSLSVGVLIEKHFGPKE